MADEPGFDGAGVVSTRFGHRDGAVRVGPIAQKRGDRGLVPGGERPGQAIGDESARRRRVDRNLEASGDRVVPLRPGLHRGRGGRCGRRLQEEVKYLHRATVPEVVDSAQREQR